MQANPGNLGNTDGFDTINSDNITIQVRGFHLLHAAGRHVYADGHYRIASPIRGMTASALSQVGGLQKCTLLLSNHLTGVWIKLTDDDLGSTNMYVKNLTCVNTAGIAIGSLGQYEGVYDLVENITAEDVTVRSLPEAQVVSSSHERVLIGTAAAHRKPERCLHQDVHGQVDVLSTPGRRQRDGVRQERV